MKFQSKMLPHTCTCLGLKHVSEIRWYKKTLSLTKIDHMCSFFFFLKGILCCEKSFLFLRFRGLKSLSVTLVFEQPECENLSVSELSDLKGSVMSQTKIRAASPLQLYSGHNSRLKSFICHIHHYICIYIFSSETLTCKKYIRKYILRKTYTE